MESCVYKIHKSKRHSGIFYGPITEVYGFGVLALILLKKYILDQLHCHKYLKVMITFLLCWITLTFIEWLGGNILEQIFHIEMWNYSKKAYHCGKFICLELSLVWGFFGTIYLYFLKDFFDKIIELIPKKLTILFILINIIDTLMVMINKLP